jgi:hypothetical protein
MRSAKRGKLMLKKSIISVCLVIFAFVFTAFAQEKTVVKSQSAKNKLLGKHLFSLQWISWDYYGTAKVTRKQGVYYLKGEQKSRENDDYLKIDGIITEINSRNFKFIGTVTTKVSHNNNGEPCVRDGQMTFAITGKRKYWRLQQMQSPCGIETDYVDIFFRR